MSWPYMSGFSNEHSYANSQYICHSKDNAFNFGVNEIYQTKITWPVRNSHVQEKCSIRLLQIWSNINGGLTPTDHYKIQ